MPKLPKLPKLNKEGATLMDDCVLLANLTMLEHFDNHDCFADEWITFLFFCVMCATFPFSCEIPCDSDCQVSEWSPWSSCMAAACVGNINPPGLPPSPSVSHSANEGATGTAEKEGEGRNQNTDPLYYRLGIYIIYTWNKTQIEQ